MRIESTFTDTGQAPVKRPQFMVVSPATASTAKGNCIGQQLGSVQSDAPFCDVRGHVTIWNGACYKCLNCVNSMGCY